MRFTRLPLKPETRLAACRLEAQFASALDMPSIDQPNGGPAAGQWFTATHWSVVLAAKGGHSPQSAEALEKLCRTYWSPLYAFVRRQGHTPQDAQDLTQDFFAWLL